MFGILFGWRKASKCKKLIKKVQCRLKLLKNKRGSIVRQLREGVAQLMQHYRDQDALNKAEEIYKDESMMEVYELLDKFCEFILIQLPYIRKNKDCPNDVNEAVSSLIFASARCGDLPELRRIRELFKDRYGHRLAITALELLPGNLVNPQLKEKLTIQSVPEDVKYRLVNEISRDCCVRPGVLAIEYAPEYIEQTIYHAENKDRKDQIQELQEQGIKSADTEGKTIYINALSCNNAVIRSRHSHSHQGSDTTTSVASSIALQSSLGTCESPTLDQSYGVGKFIEPQQRDHKFTSANLETIGSQRTVTVYNTNSENKEQGMTNSSSSESLAQFPEKTMVYLDDVQEYQSSFLSNSGDWQDQRLFKFKSSMQQGSQIPEVGCQQSQEDRYQWQDEKPRSSKKSVKSPGESLRRRSLSRQCQFMNDFDYAYYYGELSNKNSRSPKQKPPRQRKRWEKTSPQERDHFYASLRQKKLPHKIDTRNISASSSSRHDIDHNTNCLVLENFDRGNLGASPGQISEITDIAASKRGQDSGDNVCQALTYTHHWSDEQTKGTNQEINSPDSSCSKGHPAITSYSTRAITMPQERKKDINKGKMIRFNKCISTQPRHVHPNLPDYDEFVAKFLSLKERLRENSL